MDESSSDDVIIVNDFQDSNWSDGDSENETTPKPKDLSNGSWDDSVDRLVILSPDSQMMECAAPNVQELKRRHSISSATRWEDDYGQQEESYVV